MRRQRSHVWRTDAASVAVMKGLSSCRHEYDTRRGDQALPPPAVIAGLVDKPQLRLDEIVENTKYQAFDSFACIAIDCPADHEAEITSLTNLSRARLGKKAEAFFISGSRIM
jgi:hypothetical protein